MFTCFVCKVHHSSCLLLCQHLKFHHGLYPGKSLRLKCGERGCSLSFCTYSGFRKHLNNIHRDTTLPHVDTTQDFPTQCVDEVQFSSNQPKSSTSAATSEAFHVRSQSSDGMSQLPSMCGSIVAHLQAAGICESTVQTIVSSMEEVVNDVHNQAREAVLKTFSPEETNSDVFKKVEHCFDQLDNPFSALNTEAKRQKHFNERWEIVQPEEHVLGVRMDVRRDRTTGIYSQFPVTDKYMYVPILGTLKSIFKNGEIRKSFLEEKLSEKGIYKDINDGSYFQNHSLFSQERYALQILLYYDDFETANPLGSKKGVHKLGGVYFTLKNLPPKCNSVLMNIHLATLFYTSDLKTYGFDEILKPLIHDLKILETQGIHLPYFEKPLFGSVIQITGDNLALNGLLGFVESFSATNFCRFCLTCKEDLQSVFTEDDPGVIFRSKELHTEHCKVLNENPAQLSVSGLKKNCAFNSLQYFHSSDNYLMVGCTVIGVLYKVDYLLGIIGNSFISITFIQ